MSPSLCRYARSRSVETESLAGPDRGTERIAGHFNIGGPIDKDRLWFFASAQLTDQSSPPDPGFAAGPEEEAPRVLGKLTSQFSPERH